MLETHIGNSGLCQQSLTHSDVSQPNSPIRPQTQDKTKQPNQNRQRKHECRSKTNGKKNELIEGKGEQWREIGTDYDVNICTSREKL